MKEFTAKMLDHCQIAKISTQQEGYMVKVFLNQNRHIQLILEKGFGLIMPAEYEVTFYDQFFGVQKCKCRLKKETQNSGMLYVGCEILEILDIKQRRENVKVPLKEKIIVFIDKGDDWFEATTKDISAGGVFFSCDKWLPHGKRVDFSLETPKKSLLLTAEVVRCSDMENGMAGYGCKFIGLPNCVESDLRSYVYQLQREMNKL